MHHGLMPVVIGSLVKQMLLNSLKLSSTHITEELARRVSRWIEHFSQGGFMSEPKWYEHNTNCMQISTLAHTVLVATRHMVRDVTFPNEWVR
jgi:hypothetical protein